MVKYNGKVFEWPLSKEDLEYFYCSEMLSGEKIAEMFGITSGTIAHWRREYKIKRVECWERHRLPNKLSKREKEVVLGHLLGDGHLGLNSKCAHLRVSQSKKQKKFVDSIYDYLKRWASYPPVEDNRFDKRYNKFYYTCRFDTFAHPAFNHLYQLCYPQDKKTVNLEWLDYIDGLGLAMWYQGDGGLSGPVTPILHTDCFSLDEQHLIIDWLKVKFNINAYTRKEGKYHKIIISNGSKFRSIIEPYVIDHFIYKLPRPRKRKLYVE